MLSVITKDQFKTNCAVCFPGWEKKIITHTDRQESAEDSFRARFIGGFDKDLLAVFHSPYAILLAGCFEHLSSIFIPSHPRSSAK